MNLKIQRNEEGIPEIRITFDQDTSDSEPYMVLQAHGFTSDEEIAGTLMDVAMSLHNNVPVETQRTYEVYPSTGRMSAEGHAWKDTLERNQRPGETILDTERRLLANGHVSPASPTATGHVPFNPKPRGQR